MTPEDEAFAEIERIQRTRTKWVPVEKKQDNKGNERPVESDYTSLTAYTRALEAYCDSLQPTPAEYAMGYVEGFEDACKKPTWVELTEKEVDEIYTSVQEEVNKHWDKGGTTMMFPFALYKAIEAKLREKNT